MISPHSTGLSMSEISQFAKYRGKGNSGTAIALWQQIQDTRLCAFLKPVFKATQIQSFNMQFQKFKLILVLFSLSNTLLI